jgi:peptidoglycan/LPS O-acetylase OafA/YrhL
MITSKPQAFRPRLAFLDWLRIFAFMSVLIGHTIYPTISDLASNQAIHPSLRLLIQFLLPWAHEGGVGVGVFFLISGYIITLVVESEDSVEYAIKRFLRIYPLYITAVIAQFILLTRSGMQPSFRVVLQQISMLGDFFQTPFSLGGVEWTLRIEILFYAFMGILAFISRRLPTKLNQRRYPFIYVAVVILLGILPPFTSGKIGWGLWPATGAVTLYAPFLLIGSMIYLFEKRLTQLKPLVVISFFIYIQYLALLPKYQPLWSRDHHALLGLTLFLLAWIFRHQIKGDKFIILIASLTYSVYLFHNWLYFALKSKLQSQGVGSAMSVLLAFIILFAVCWASMVLVEKPGISLGKKLIALRNTNFV